MRALRTRTHLPGLAFLVAAVAAALAALAVSRALVDFDGWPSDPQAQTPAQLAVPAAIAAAPRSATGRPPRADAPAAAAAPAPATSASSSGGASRRPRLARVTPRAAVALPGPAPEAARPQPREPAPPAISSQPAQPRATPLAPAAELARATADSLQRTLRATAAAVGDLLPGR